MMFNGTEFFEKNELAQALRDMGMEFGADLNAFTGPDETGYTLSFQLEDGEKLDLAFKVLSQWASAATLHEEDVEAERGVVLDEQRLREETATGGVLAALQELWFRGSVYEGVAIGGTKESNSQMSAEQLRGFYDLWYRPDNMAVVAVGDVDVSDLERRLVESFGDLGARTPSAPAQPERHPFSAAFSSETQAAAVTHPDIGDQSVQLQWRLPAWPEGTAGGERLGVAEDVIARMLKVRLDAAYQAGLLTQTTEPEIHVFAMARALRFLGTNYQGPDLAAATTDFVSVVRGASRWGFTQSEMAQAVEAINASLDLELQGEATRQDYQFSQRYQSHFLTGADISSTADRAARRRCLLESFTPRELTAHLRWLFDLGAPLVVSSGPDPAEVPTAGELVAAVAAAVPLAAPEAESAVQALMQPPQPVSPVSEGELDLFEGAYEWVFPNGARAVFVPSDIAAGEVSVVAESLGGTSTLSPGDSALAPHAVAAVVASGAGTASATQLDEFLAGSTASVRPFISEHSEGFFGTAGTGDLETLLVLMHLYVTSPNLTDVALREQVQAMGSSLASSQADPLFIAELALLDAQYQGSEWHQMIATQDQIDSVTKQTLRRLYEARLSDVDDLTVVFVGDIDRDTVADLAARYIGTLPAGEADTFVNRQPPFPAGVDRITVPVAAGGGNAGFDIFFGAESAITAESLVAADIVSTIVRELLSERVREELGDAYSTSAFIMPSEATGTWTARISSTGSSAGLERGHEQVLAILTGLISDGPAERDLQQAIEVLSDNYAFESNFDIVRPLLRRLHLDDEDVGTRGQLRAALANVTAEGVHRYIKVFFDLENRIEVFRSAERAE